jgi:glycine cleavage system H protein
MSSSSPENLKYSKTHEWVKIEGTGATVGITHHAQEALGDITFIELPAVGTDVARDGACCVIESVKAASDINTPVAGRISEVNQSLENAPESVNKDPYGAGWIFKLSDVKIEEAAGLMDAGTYDAFVENDT